MIEAELVNIGTSEVRAERLFEGDPPPDWLPTAEENGSIGIRMYGKQQVLVTVTAGMANKTHAVRVTLAALYKTAVNIFDEHSEEEILDFARRHLTEQIPFLRQAVYNASSQVWPVQPIILDIRPDATVVHEPARVSLPRQKESGSGVG